MIAHYSAMEGSGWRIETACRAAWPAARTAMVDGWLLGLSGGESRRITCATPLDAGAALDDGSVARIADAFAVAGQDALFRVPALLPGIDAVLDRAGFAPPEGRTRTLTMMLDPRRRGGSSIVLEPAPGADWLATRHRLSILLEGRAVDYAAPLSRVAVPVCFARTRATGAIGYVAVDRDVAVLEAVATDPAVRREGHATRVVAALLAWAAEAGATCAALQVRADNAPAIALYRRLGFLTDAYDYHYRRRCA